MRAILVGRQALMARLAPANPRGGLPAAYAWVELDTEHVILKTVKKAEDDQAWIVRVYECKQYRSNTVPMTFGQSIQQAVACNLLEEDEGPVPYHGDKITFDIKPFEIKTFKVWF